MKKNDPIKDFEQDIESIKRENLLFKNEFKRFLTEKEPDEWIEEIQIKKKSKKGFFSNLFGFFIKR
jgi:hypothetical protein